MAIPTNRQYTHPLGQLGVMPGARSSEHMKDHNPQNTRLLGQGEHSRFQAHSPASRERRLSSSEDPWLTVYISLKQVQGCRGFRGCGDHDAVTLTREHHVQELHLWKCALSQYCKSYLLILLPFVAYTLQSARTKSKV